MGARPLRDTLSARDDLAPADGAAAQDQALRQMVSDVERHQRALEENPGDVETVLSAARFCQGIGKVQEASALYVQAMTLAPDRPEGFVGMGQLLRGQAMHSEAVDLLKEAIARNPGSAPLWHAIAQVMTDLDDVETALMFYDEAVRLAPDLMETRLRRAAYLLTHARHVEALRDYDLLRAAHPRDSRVLTGWGDVKTCQGQRAEARIAAPTPTSAAPAIDADDAKDPRRFTYDLGVAPISYDVVWFLGMARNRGIRHVDIVPGPHFGFRDDGWYQKADVAEKHFRLWNIVVPACQLAGMTVSVQPDRAKAVRTIYRPEPLFVEGIRDDVFHATDHSRRWVRQWLAARGLTRPVVITLRESHWASRNSNMDAWRRFAAETNAVVIPDTEGSVAFGHVFDGINMDRRMALYQEASVCMGTNGGPLALVFMTRSIPYLIFKMVSDYPASTVEAYAKRGFPVGTQFRWAGPQQRLVWADDDYDTIRAAYDVFLARSAR